MGQHDDVAVGVRRDDALGPVDDLRSGPDLEAEDEPVVAAGPEGAKTVVGLALLGHSLEAEVGRRVVGVPEGGVAYRRRGVGPRAGRPPADRRCVWLPGAAINGRPAAPSAPNRCSGYPCWWSGVSQPCTSPLCSTHWRLSCSPDGRPARRAPLVGARVVRLHLGLGVGHDGERERRGGVGDRGAAAPPSVSRSRAGPVDAVPGGAVVDTCSGGFGEVVHPLTARPSTASVAAIASTASPHRPAPHQPSPRPSCTAPCNRAYAGWSPPGIRRLVEDAPRCPGPTIDAGSADEAEAGEGAGVGVDPR